MEKSGEKLLKIAKFVCFIVLFTPLVLGPFGLSISNYAKAIFFRTLVEFVFIIYLYLVCFKKFPTPKFSLLSFSLLLSLLILFVSGIFGFNFKESFWGDMSRGEGIIFYLHLYVFFIILSSIFIGKKDWLTIFRLTCMVGFLSSLAGFLQKAGIASFYGIVDGGRISGTWTNPDFFGPYLTLNIFLVIFLLFLEEKSSWRKFWFLVFLSDIIALILSQTRSAWIGFGMGFIFLLLYYFLFSEEGEGKRKIFLFSALAITLLLAIFCYYGVSFGQNNSILSRFYSIFNIYSLDNSRLTVWKVAYQSWLEKPVFGWGLESFGYLYDKHYNAEFLKAISESIYFDRAHSKIFDQLSSTGLAGVLGYFFTLAVLFFYLAKGKEYRQPNKQTDASKPRAQFFQKPILRVILMSLIIANFFQGFFIFDTLGTCLIFTIISAFLDANFILPSLRSGHGGLPVFKNFLTSIKPSFAKFYNSLPRVISKIFALIIFFGLLFFSVYFFYEANFKTFLASRKFVIASYSNDPKKAIVEYEKGIGMKTFYDREFAMTAVANGIAILENNQVPKDTEAEALRMFSEAQPFLEESLGEPETGTIRSYEMLARIEERNYLFSKDASALIKMEDICWQELDFQNQTIESYRLLGRVRFYQGRYDEGEAFFKKSLDLVNDNASGNGDYYRFYQNNRYYSYHNYYGDLAVAYLRAGNEKSAGENFKKVVDIDMAASKFAIRDMSQKEIVQVLSFAEKVAQFFLKDLGDRKTFNDIFQKAIASFPVYEKQLKYDLEMTGS